PPGVVPEHLHGLQVWLDGLDEWQARYVDGIRQEDAGAMQQALEELDGQLAGLHDDLLARLEEAGGELVAQLADARSAIEPLLGDCLRLGHLPLEVLGPLNLLVHRGETEIGDLVDATESLQHRLADVLGVDG